MSLLMAGGLEPDDLYGAFQPKPFYGSKKCTIQSWSQSQLLPHGKNGGAEHSPPQLLSFTKAPRWHMARLCWCHPRPRITLLNWPQISHISSPAHCLYLHLQGCGWCFPEDWKSYRSSLNLRDQAKQTGREQNSSGCLTHTGCEIMYRLYNLLLNIHTVCYSLCSPIPKALGVTDTPWGRHKYHNILLYLFQTP